MNAPQYPNSHTEPAAETDGSTGLYDVLRAGSAMFESPSIRRTFRLAETTAIGIAACVVLAAYVTSHGRLVRYSGKEDHRLDQLMAARKGVDGVLPDGEGWRFALFFRGSGKLKGAFALQATEAPSTETMRLLSALAEPTGAALATAELIDRQRRQTKELRRLSKANEASNQVMAGAIVQLRARQEIRDSIVAAAGTGDGQAQIVETLSRITSRSVVLQDSFGNELAQIIVDPATPAITIAPLGSASTAREANSGWHSLRISSRGETLGAINIYDPDDSRSEDDRFAVEYASATLAVELAHRRSVAEVELRLGRDLADDLVSGNEVVDALARAGALGFDLGGLHRAVLVTWESPTPNGVDVSAAVRYQLAAMHVPALISRRPDATLAIVGDGHDLSQLYDRVSAALNSGRGTIGVGGRSAAGDLARSYTEATQALRIRAESRRPLGLANHDELGLLRILDTSEDGLRLKGYIDDWLGVLLEHDRRHRTDLVRTLAAYLDSGGNYDHTSAALVIHRSTLRYRLGRIRDVSGLDLNDPESRLNLHIAIRARDSLTDYFG
jgi:hypothetical protein